MKDDSLRILRNGDISRLLNGLELDITAAVSEAYVLHSEGKSSLPHSTFLRFPGRSADRIIGLPAYLNTDEEIAGIKWIASFPENIERGIERASAVLLLNDTITGRPYCLMEASLISASRTAASAALAASLLATKRGAYQKIAIVGCGPINKMILSYIVSTLPSVNSLMIYDIDPERAKDFASYARHKKGISQVNVCKSLKEATLIAGLVSIATSAIEPYIDSMSVFQSNAVILHVSLRDFTPQAILSSINIVDDVDHVNREHTSIHLTSKQTGNTDFISGNISDLIIGKNIIGPSVPVIFSPFGLGILDIATAGILYKLAVEQDVGVLIPEFLGSSGAPRV